MTRGHPTGIYDGVTRWRYANRRALSRGLFVLGVLIGMVGCLLISCAAVGILLGVGGGR